MCATGKCGLIMSADFYDLVAQMRQAQRELQGNYTRGQLDKVGKLEAQVDQQLNVHQREVQQLDLWTRSAKHSETAGAYNVRDEATHEE